MKDIKVGGDILTIDEKNDVVLVNGKESNDWTVAKVDNKDGSFDVVGVIKRNTNVFVSLSGKTFKTRSAEDL